MLKNHWPFVFLILGLLFFQPMWSQSTEIDCMALPDDQAMKCFSIQLQKKRVKEEERKRAEAERRAAANNQTNCMKRPDLQQAMKCLWKNIQNLGEENKRLQADVASMRNENKRLQNDVTKLTDAVRVAENGNVGRTIAYATGNGPNDGTDVGQIKSRVLRFTKAKATTKLRISYTDNFRTKGTFKACRWEIRVDGKSCPKQPLIYDDYAASNGNTHSSHTIVGYCSGLAAGTHTIGIWVSNTPSYSGSNCYTGWNNSTWVLEAEEVN
ncbi:hypothetical protein TI05_00070 [Achromatium sp. WMS3]|nr:hypothetical protein TI05_00070 [Achromatium sp. WMS3]